jgi:type II secretory pathway pseudopilin PulG
MVTVAARIPHRRDPVRPAGRLTVVGILAAGAALSVLGWTFAAHLGEAEQDAATAQRITQAAVRDEQLAESEAARAGAQRDALAALVVYRCDTGQITDEQLCLAARGQWHR